MAKLTPGEKNKYQQMVERRFEQVERDADILESALEAQVMQQVRRDWKIDEAEAQVEEARRNLKRMKAALATILGMNEYDRTSRFDQSKISLIRKEANRRLEKMGSIVHEVRQAKTDAIEAIWLADAPTAVAEMLTKMVDEIVKPLANRINGELQLQAPEELKQIEADPF